MWWYQLVFSHYTDVIMGAMASQIISLTVVYSTVYSNADQRKHQSSASLAFVRGIHRWPVNSPHKWPVTRKIFPFDDVIMASIFLVHAQATQLTRGGHFVDDIFKYISFCENCCVLLQVSQNFVSSGQFNYKSCSIGLGDGLASNRWQL